MAEPLLLGPKVHVGEGTLIGVVVVAAAAAVVSGEGRAGVGRVVGQVARGHRLVGELVDWVP